MIAWSRLARARSAGGIWAIFASCSLSPSALPAAAFTSRARSLIASRSSAVNILPVALAPLADFGAAFVPGFFAAMVLGDLLYAPLSGCRHHGSDRCLFLYRVTGREPCDRQQPIRGN